MVKVKVRAGKEAVAQAQSNDGDFGDPPLPGLYHLRLDGLDKRTTKEGANKGKAYLNCRWAPVGVGREGAKPEKKLGSVWDVVALESDDSEWARARFAMAMGQTPNKAGVVELSVELDADKPDSPIGTVVLGRVGKDKDLDGNYKPKIAWIGPLEGGTPEEGEAFTDDEGEEVSDEEEADTPFEDADEDDGDYYTREQLEELDPKALGAAAREFDLDTKDFVVKATKGANKGKVDLKKTSAAIIDAILEAQGADNEEEDEGDDVNPF